MKKIPCFKFSLLLIIGLIFSSVHLKAQDIVGPTTISCATATTYSFPLRYGESIVWTVSGVLTISGSNTSSSVIVIANSYGTGTLTATVGGGSCMLVEHLTIENDPPPVTISGPEDICVNTATNSYSVTAVPGATAYTWSASNPNMYTGSANGLTIPSMSFTASAAGSTIVYCVITTPCGTINAPTFGVTIHPRNPLTNECDYVDGGGGDGDYAIKPYPNPADDHVIVSSKPNVTTTTAPQAKPFQYKLYDKLGKIVRQGTSNGEDLNVNVLNLPGAIYILHITIDNKLTVKQIIVQHNNK